MSTQSSNVAPGAPSVTSRRGVSVAVIAVDDDIRPTLEAIGRQVYEPSEIVVVGGPESFDSAADRREVSLADYVASLAPDIGFVWLVHGDAVPRPDALGAMLRDLGRLDAALVGSKVLHSDDPERLELVGAATDVFGVPYTGLDEGEVDLEQYDVVRDVAFVSGVSVLVRRDLLRGLGGTDPRLAPLSAGLDLSQRARLAGGRVIVSPASEVLHADRCEHRTPNWREEAGRMRAMLKAYRLITLFWVVPVDALVSLFAGLARVFMGQVRPLASFVTAVAWNIAALPSTLVARRRLGRLRTVGDEELFRYQVGGSERFRQLASDVSSRFDERLGDDGLAGLTDRVTRLAPVPAILTGVLVILTGRGIWFGGLPTVGHTGAISDAAAVLSSFAGGWNGAGLGSPDPVHPSAAALAAVDWLVGGRQWTGTLLTAVLMVLAVMGFARILQRRGWSGTVRYSAAIGYALGPGVGWLAGHAYWPAFLALAGGPWLIDLAVAPRPRGVRGAVGRVGRLALAGTAVGVGAPVLLIVVPVICMLGWSARTGWRASSILWAAVGSAFGLVAILPWVVAQQPDILTEQVLAADLSVNVAVWTLIVGVGMLAAVLADRESGALAAVGVLMVGAGLFGMRTGSWEVMAASMLMASLGVGFVAAGALHTWRSERPRFLAAPVAAGGVVVVLLSLGLAPGGRLGFPQDQWGSRLDFASVLSEVGGSSRVLLVGDPADLPGDSRSGPGFAYRVESVPGPAFEASRLPEPRLGDRALDETLARIAAAADLRPGASLAPFGVRWLVVVGDAVKLVDQLDMRPVPLSEDLTVYENEVWLPRVRTAAGLPWAITGGTATGEPVDAITVADNAHSGWGPGWRQEDWFNVLDGSTGRVMFVRDGTRSSLAWTALVTLVLAGVAAIWGTRRRDEMP